MSENQSTSEDSSEGSDTNERRRYEPPIPPTFGKKKKFTKGPSAASKLPIITPNMDCCLKALKLYRIEDYLIMEEEFLMNVRSTGKSLHRDYRKATKKMEKLRGHPMHTGVLEEIIDDRHAIVSSCDIERYVNILSFVDKNKLEIGCTVLLHNKYHAVVGVLPDDDSSIISAMKLEKAPEETYGDIGGLDKQIQEIKEAVELPLTHPELYEDMGISPPKGVIFYGPSGTGKTLLAKAVANHTSATFLRVAGTELIQKYSGEGAKLIRKLFKVATEYEPTIIFIDEIDAIGTKRYNSNSGGELEIQRTMLELLNQLDGFNSRNDVKVIMATNRIESLDSALLRPGRVDRKIEFPLPDEKMKQCILNIHTSKMSLAEGTDLQKFIMTKDDLSGADIKAICTEAGFIALRERRMKLIIDDFNKAKEKVLSRKQNCTLEGLYS